MKDCAMQSGDEQLVGGTGISLLSDGLDEAGGAAMDW